MVSNKFGPGTVVADRFEVECETDSGGMGTVYRAKDRSSGSLVALKLLKATFDPASRQRFVREAQVLAELRHPGIVSYVAHGQLSDGRAYLAMDWLSGEALAKRLHRGPLGLSHCMALFRRLVDALAEAHRHGVTHRDLKPSNIFLVDGQVERAVLIDFGIARHVSGEITVTGAGVMVGTPGYMAPEQARGERSIMPSADIFSLGCLFYQCLTGQAPFASEHIAAVLAKTLYEECPPVTDFQPRVPAALAELIHRMLTKESAGRPRDAMALQEELSRMPALPLHDVSHETRLERTVSTPTPTPTPALTSSEQIVVSVVMASVGETSDALDETAATHSHATLTRDLESFGAKVSWLANGTMVATLTRQGSNAVDLVGVAAQCALVVQECWPKAHVALATGLGLLRDHHPAIGQAIDKAVQLVHGPRATPNHDNQDNQDNPGTPRSGVWLDDVSAGLLRGRFAQTHVISSSCAAPRPRHAGGWLRMHLRGKLGPGQGQRASAAASMRRTCGSNR